MFSLKPFIRIPVFLLVLVLSAGCGEDTAPSDPGIPEEPIRSILALGDSYTVGHSLPVEWSWPYQLADSLAAVGDSLTALQIVAQTGWTTRDLLDATRVKLNLGELLSEPYGLVSLMIGVNNQFQGLEPLVFEVEMDTLISLALDLAGGDSTRVLGFSIPDYGVTPVGQMFDPARTAGEIEAYNATLARKFGERGIIMLDVTTLSRLAGDEPQLVARDGLHYSREMYRRWVTLMLDQVRYGLGTAR